MVTRHLNYQTKAKRVSWINICVLIILCTCAHRGSKTIRFPTTHYSAQGGCTVPDNSWLKVETLKKRFVKQSVRNTTKNKSDHNREICDFGHLSPRPPWSSNTSKTYFEQYIGEKCKVWAPQASVDALLRLLMMLMMLMTLMMLKILDFGEMSPAPGP